MVAALELLMCFACAPRSIPNEGLAAGTVTREGVLGVGLLANMGSVERHYYLDPRPFAAIAMIPTDSFVPEVRRAFITMATPDSLAALASQLVGQRVRVVGTLERIPTPDGLGFQERVHVIRIHLLASDDQ
jgi:hypothetical protein